MICISIFIGYLELSFAFIKMKLQKYVEEGKGSGVAVFRIGGYKRVMKVGTGNVERGHMLRNDGVSHVHVYPFLSSK